MDLQRWYSYPCCGVVRANGEKPNTLGRKGYTHGGRKVIPMGEERPHPRGRSITPTGEGRSHPLGGGGGEGGGEITPGIAWLSFACYFYFHNSNVVKCTHLVHRIPHYTAPTRTLYPVWLRSAELNTSIIHIYDGRGSTTEVATLNNIHSSPMLFMEVKQFQFLLFPCCAVVITQHMGEGA